MNERIRAPTVAFLIYNPFCGLLAGILMRWIEAFSFLASPENLAVSLVEKGLRPAWQAWLGSRGELGRTG